MDLVGIQAQLEGHLDRECNLAEAISVMWRFHDCLAELLGKVTGVSPARVGVTHMLIYLTQHPGEGTSAPSLPRSMGVGRGL